MRPVDGPELQVAIDWWAAQLEAKPTHNVGTQNRDSMDLLILATERMRLATPEQIEQFKQHLKAAILRNARWAETWQAALNTKEPMRGQAFRTLATDYGPMRELKQALEAAGLSALSLPMKTVMWVSPGQVHVGCGYGSPIESLYEEALV